ncbi:hypothetical protein UFOVP1544_39 [uncultured Caudovirales phage]|uniref:Uncharacterized protein n=1 Tax=uncultured Caudovirales phage TaxID=2100421 RepID=A0A6J7XDL3_9CAUD|nr:hypothetical protein UFOVP1544_39 [uncultured Caudovirales phage]
MANVTQIPAPRVAFTQDGQITTQWFRWLNNVYTITGSGLGITPVINGGTGLGTIPTNGQLLIGNGTGYSLNTLTAGTGITVTNGAGAISIVNNGVTSVSGTGTVNGITLTGTVTTAGNLTLGGTLSGVSLTTQVSGTLPIANGGTGTTSTAFASLTTNVSGILPIANGGTGTSTAGVSATIVTAKLTALGADGSMTFTNGLLTAQTPAT